MNVEVNKHTTQDFEDTTRKWSLGKTEELKMRHGESMAVIILHP